LVAERIDSLEGIAALAPLYAELGRAAGDNLPFATHEWHLVWCENFLNLNRRISDQPAFHVIRDQAGACVAIFPLITSRRLLGARRSLSVNLLGADPAITEIRTPLIAAGREAEALRALRLSLADFKDWDWIQWTGMNDALNEAVASTGTLEPEPTLINYVLDLAPTWEEFRSRLKRNIRESLRHCYNSLKRDGHSFEFHVARTPAEVAAALDRFHILHMLRAQATDMAPHPDRFKSKVLRRFLAAVCERFAARGAVRIFELCIGGKAVATRIGFVVGDSLYLYYSGFDPSWSQYGVMTTTVAEAIKYAIGQGLHSVSLSPGTDVSKTRWGPREVLYRGAFEWRDRLRSRAARWVYLTARSGTGLRAKLLRLLIPAQRNWS
jgi:CelD/BcsL family acetyltransferase involved in cellulose biosynthesis